MTSYILSFFNYFFSKNTKDDSDDDKENFLAEQILDLEVIDNQCENHTDIVPCEIPRSAVCFQRTGLITYIDVNNYILIDGLFYFDISCSSLNLNVNDKILYLGYKGTSESSTTVVRILQNYGKSWDEDDDTEETNFKVIEHVIVGEVDYRKDRFVYMKQSYLKFNLDDVEGTFVPVKGDWLELKCTAQWDEDRPLSITEVQVLQVISFKPLRSKITNAVVTNWSGDSGICDRHIFFNQQSLQNETKPQVGTKVLVEVVESNQGMCIWRAIKLMSINNNSNEIQISDKPNDEKITLELEKEKNIEITYPLKFDNIDIQQTAKISLNVTNNSDQLYVLKKWVMLTRKRDSQIIIEPFLSQPRQIYPKQTICFTITCRPKFLGNSKECLVMMFKGFQLKRFIEINVVHNIIPNVNTHNIRTSKQCEHVVNMKKIRKDDKAFIPGVRVVKPPAFIPTRLGTFPIPEKIWSAVLGDSEQTTYSPEFDKILARIEMNLPCLSQDLNISNYIDRWHSLLYMEEIQANLAMRSYDMPKAFLIQCQEYLSIEIEKLSERRPSLIKGDRVIVKDVWNTNAPQYEGFIHVIKGDLILIKFNQQFHETYSGSDVSIEFHFSRTVYRRCHQAINLALSNLGPDILFPKYVCSRAAQVSNEKLKKIDWYNKSLNIGQKTAITNILLGECRPMPYCIYGPPGTGKTVTVIETILQLLTLLPDSRILVATPSNSASNLITERLIQYRNVFTGSFVRLLANYLLDSDGIPDIIKPFCATLDIAKEESARSNHKINKDGISINCQTSFIGRHRVTIGTCYCIGTLAQMGLPRGHFTHVIVDEAGQATEPEIMIPMTFIDKENGQIILAGDPMQLGPVIISKYCKFFGLNVSYLSRILETFPYQKDYEAFEDGFNKKLVTRLNDNYRSLKEVLTLPSEMFYNASLAAKINSSESWILKILDVIFEVFDVNETKTGGIFVYGIRGCNARALDTPSWYNPQEATMVALTTCKLYKKNITADEIGIITPYIAQIKHLRLLFEAMGLPQPKIGTVEEFQGQERPIILISTVRSSETYIQEDIKNTLGFVKNPKRLNVALTRAQIAAFLFCDPHLLCKDPLWNKVLTHAVKEDKYMGCDLPNVITGIN